MTRQGIYLRCHVLQRYIKSFCHTNITETIFWMTFSMILFDFSLTPHPISGKAIVQRESEGVSVSQTLTPTLPLTLPLTLHPHVFRRP